MLCLATEARHARKAGGSKVASYRVYLIASLFFTVSETGRDVVEKYIETPMGSLAPHKFVNLTEVNPDFAALPKSNTTDDPFN